MMKIDQMPSEHDIENVIKNGVRLGFPNRLFLIDPKRDGSFRWRVGFNYKGSRRELGVGHYPEISPDQAMQRALAIHAQVDAGLDPSAERRRLDKSDKYIESEVDRHEVIRHDSFYAVAIQWVENPLRNVCEKTRDVERGRIINHLKPILGNKLLSEIQAKNIYRACELLLEKKKIDTAGRVARLCSNIFNHGILLGYASENPCRVVLESLPKSKKRHFPALTNPAHLAEILPRVFAYGGTPAVCAALKLISILMVRPGNLRMADWDEFDLEQGLWLIPASKMKSSQDDKEVRKPHVVPLPAQAVSILRELYPLTGDSGKVFPSKRKRNKYISDGTINKALRRIGVSTSWQMTGHGFRAVARTMLKEQLGFSTELIELQLDHAVKDTNGRAYNRTELVRERQKMLQVWADYLDDLRLGRIVYDDPLARFTPITCSGKFSTSLMAPEIHSKAPDQCVVAVDPERPEWFKKIFMELTECSASCSPGLDKFFDLVMNA